MADSKNISNLEVITPSSQLSEMAGKNISFHREEWEVMKGMAQVFVQSGAFPATDNMAKIMVKMQAGRELGMQPVQAIQSMFFVHGKLGMYGNALLALMKKNGLIVKWTELTPKKVSAEFSSKDQPAVTIEFGEEDAKRAQLGGDNYKKYPQDMFVARCVSRAAKLFPELVGAPIETVEVLEDIHGVEETTASVVASDAPQVEGSALSKLNTPAEKKEIKKQEKEAEVVPNLMENTKVAEIIEEMKIAVTIEDMDGCRELICSQSWGKAEAMFLGERYAHYIGMIKRREKPQEEAIDMAEAVADVFEQPSETKLKRHDRDFELRKMKSVDLKPILSEYGIDFAGMDKEARLNAILNHEYGESQNSEEPVVEIMATAPEQSPFLSKLFNAGN